MINIRNNMIVAIALTAFSVMPANVALSKGNDVRLAGSNQTKTLDCPGGWARISGANSNVTLTGNCAGLTLHGSGNAVTAAFQAGARFDHARYLAERGVSRIRP